MTDEIIGRLLKWAEGGRAPPETVQIYPTNRCNLRCIFCSLRVQKFDYKDELPKKRWLELTEEICRTGVEGLLISGGGEPFCVPEIVLGIMRVAKSHGLRGRVINNGTLWTQKLIEEVIKIGWDDVTFSIDGPDADTHDFLRGARSFKKIIENITLFNRIKKRMGSDKPVLELTTVLCKHNYAKIVDMINLAKTLSMECVNFEPVCMNNLDVEKIKLNQKERKELLRKILPRAQKLAEKYKINTNLSRLRDVKYVEKTGRLKETILKRSCKASKETASNPFLYLPCYEPWIWPKIEANGDVWPCSTVQFKTNVETKPFKKVWYGKEFNMLRKRIVRRDLPSECENCVSTHLPINKEIGEKLRNAFLGENYGEGKGNS